MEPDLSTTGMNSDGFVAKRDFVNDSVNSAIVEVSDSLTILASHVPLVLCTLVSAANGADGAAANGANVGHLPSTIESIRLAKTVFLRALIASKSSKLALHNGHTQPVKALDR